MWKKRLRRLLMIALWAVYGIAIAEISVRVLSPQPLMPRYITGTPWGVRGNIHGAHYSHHTPEVSVQYRINNQGMRADRDYPLQPPPDTCRIAVLGDSFLMGYELQLEQTITSVLERELNRRGISSEVLNFSVSGLGTAEMLLTYRAYVRMFNPDMVLMQWHETDFDDNVRSNLFVLDREGLRQESSTYQPSVAVQDALMRFTPYRIVADNSHLYSVLRERAASAIKSLLVTTSERSATVPEAKAGPQPAEANMPTWSSYAVTLASRLLDESRKEIEADGRAFLVLDIPVPEARVKLHSRWHLLLQPTIGDIPVFHVADVLDPMITPNRKLYYERGHGHLTPEAASWIGAELAARLDDTLRTRHCGGDGTTTSN